MNARTNDTDSAVGGTAPAGDSPTARVSSPASTGGAGTTFEQHVGAYWLAQLLVGAIPPIAIDTTVAEVSFQTERLGWHTDDFLVVCTFGGVSRKLPGQVKRSFTVSASDPKRVCRPSPISGKTSTPRTFRRIPRQVCTSHAAWYE